MYTVMIRWSDGAETRTTFSEAVKAADYLYNSASEAARAEQAIKEGRPPDEGYTENYEGTVAVRIVRAELFEEEDE